MGSWRKVGAFLGLVPDEGRRDEFGDDYADADGYRDDYDGADHHAPDYSSAPYRGDDYDRGHESAYPAPRPVPGYGDEHATQGALAMQARTDQRREPESTGAIRPITVKLTGFSEARVIGEKFREGKPVILDMTEMDDAGARRLVDFAAGLAFALRRHRCGGHPHLRARSGGLLRRVRHRNARPRASGLRRGARRPLSARGVFGSFRCSINGSRLQRLGRDCRAEGSYRSGYRVKVDM
jgi:cell division inhibitor SepF